MGQQYGRQLIKQGRTLEEATAETLDPPDERLQFARECAKYVEEHAPYLLDELRGIAEEVGADPEVVRAVSLALDVRAGCSLVAISGRSTADGSVLFGRNHDFYPSFRSFATLYRTQPAEGLASVGCATIYVGRCDGINEAGLAIGFAEIPPHEFDPGFTWQLAIRAVLDRCETVDDAVVFLESIPHATNVNFLAVDASGEIAIVEASPDRVTTTRADDDLVSVTNQFHSESMRQYQSVDRTPADCARLQAIEQWFDRRQGGITLDSLQTAMGDQDVGVSHPIESDNPRSTLWSWTIDPVERAGYLSKESPNETPYEFVAVPG